MQRDLLIRLGFLECASWGLFLLCLGRSKGLGCLDDLFLELLSLSFLLARLFDSSFLV